jgi:hypothetical protein
VVVSGPGRPGHRQEGGCRCPARRREVGRRRRGALSGHQPPHPQHLLQEELQQGPPHAPQPPEQ